MTAALPEPFSSWFRVRGWIPHPHQLAMVEAARKTLATLLIAPTGGGKTLSGFLPSLIDLSAGPQKELHTLYVSPLKALTQDVHRNLMLPIAEMGLSIVAETRTGDTPAAKRARQQRRPPQILLTTPESLALLLSHRESWTLFRHLRTTIVDEVHALAGTKRGDLLALGLARLSSIAPFSRRIGLSATVAWPHALRSWLSPTGRADETKMIEADHGSAPDVHILEPQQGMPWAGHMALHAMPHVYEAIRSAGTTIVFVNTRAQAEIVFRTLWHLNRDHLPIALHHGSLDVAQRRKVEEAMAAGRLRAVVATSSLDLGIDWAAVDLVIQVGAPKGVSRLLQRIGRAGHQFDRVSRAILVPANRFEVLECRAALDGLREGTLDGDPPAPGGLDVLAQHLLGTACAGPFEADALFAEVTRASPYAALDRHSFDQTLEFVASGGYALKSYERYRRLSRDDDGRYRLVNRQCARLYRMNVGTIVEAMTVKVRLKKGGILGEVEEYFIQMLQPGDTFIFAGQVLRFEGMRETNAIVSRAEGADPKVPAYAGGRLPLSTHLAGRVRRLLASPDQWGALPDPVREWLMLQGARSTLPAADDLLVETFPRAGREFLVAYCFEGRNVHQTLGMLLTRRLERMGAAPLGFVATDYVLAVWSLYAADNMAQLFAEDLLGDDLEDWMNESSVMRRTFRNVAVIAGLIERRHPGHEKTGRQVTFNSDLIYNVLRTYEPDHVLLRATRDDAARGLVDLGRLTAFLRRIRGRIILQRLSRVSPLAVPVLLEIGKEQVMGAAVDELLDRTARALIREAIGDSAMSDAAVLAGA